MPGPTAARSPRPTRPIAQSIVENDWLPVGGRSHGTTSGWIGTDAWDPQQFHIAGPGEFDDFAEDDGRSR